MLWHNILNKLLLFISEKIRLYSVRLIRMLRKNIIYLRYME